MKRISVLLISVVLLLTNIQGFAAVPAGSISCLEKSNPDYMFRVAGSDKRFLLLETTDDKDSKFLLMGIDYYGQGPFDEFKSQKFDIEQSTNVGYKLNKILISDGIQQNFTKITYSLPAKVVDYIDFRHIWETKGSDNPNSIAKNDYKTVCGINLLTQDDFLRYSKIIGAKDELFDRKDSPNGNAWWFRDGAKNGADMLVMRTSGTITIGTWGSQDASPYYRPIFYVNRDFFSDVPIELSSAGKEVLAIFKKNYTAGELRKIYEDKDIYDILKYTPNIEVNVSNYSNGQEDISSLKGVKHIIANINVTNNMQMAETGILIMTYYDVYGRATMVASKKMLISADETRNSVLEMYLAKEPDEGSYIKVTFLTGNKLCQLNNSVKLYY